MLLNEIAGPAEPVYACWREDPEVGGYTLYGLSPIAKEFELAMASAKDKGEDKRMHQLNSWKTQYDKQGILTVEKPITTWPDPSLFDAGKPNLQGDTKRDVYARYPNLRIFSSREEAEEEMKKANLL